MAQDERRAIIVPEDQKNFFMMAGYCKQPEESYGEIKLVVNYIGSALNVDAEASAAEVKTADDGVLAYQDPELQGEGWCVISAWFEGSDVSPAVSIQTLMKIAKVWDERFRQLYSERFNVELPTLENELLGKSSRL